jgi:hypothetical protein
MTFMPVAVPQAFSCKYVMIGPEKTNVRVVVGEPREDVMTVFKDQSNLLRQAERGKPSTHLIGGLSGAPADINANMVGQYGNSAVEVQVAELPEEKRTLLFAALTPLVRVGGFDKEILLQGNF